MNSLFPKILKPLSNIKKKLLGLMSNRFLGMQLHIFVYLVKVCMTYLASFFVIIKSTVVARDAKFGPKVTKSM